MPPVRIAVSGYYGCGNTGDEAVLAGIVESFARRAGPAAAQFTVLSQDPEDTKRRHGLNAVRRMDSAEVRRAIRESDLLISGGGSLLQDVTSLRSLLYYLWVIYRARQLGKPVMFYAQGIGPLRRAISKYLVKLAGNSAQQITVRDKESAELLKRIGVTRPPIEVTADPAFALISAGQQRARELLAEAGVPGGTNLIGVALRPWESHTPYAAYSSMLDSMADEFAAHVLFLPMQPPGDVSLAKDIGSRMNGDSTVLEAELTPQELIAVSGELNLLIGMRLHALIFGAMAGAPLVGLSYDPKVNQLMKRLGQEDSVVDMRTLEPARVLQAARVLMSEGESRRDVLKARVAELGERALVNVDRAMMLIRQ